MGCTSSTPPAESPPAEASNDLSEWINPRQIDEVYDVQQEIRRSGRTIIRRAIRRADGIQVAIKSMPHDKVGETTGNAARGLAREVRTMASLQHRHVLRLLDLFVDAECAWLVLELCVGGDLHDLLDRRGGALSEVEARSLLGQLLSAVAHMHENNVIHRDLKLENVLLSSRAADAEVRVCDFGFAKSISELAGRAGVTSAPGRPKRSDTMLGTPDYIAPEILASKNYDVYVDIYACGCVAFALLSGRLPFDGDVLLFNVANGRPAQRTGPTHGPEWASVSPDARRFVSSMLEPSWRKRPSAAKLLSDPWLEGSSEASGPAAPRVEWLASAAETALESKVDLGPFESERTAADDPVGSRRPSDAARSWVACGQATPPAVPLAAAMKTDAPALDAEPAGFELFVFCTIGGE